MKMKISLFPILGMVLCFFGGSFCILSGNVSNVEMEERLPKECRNPKAKHGTVLSKDKWCTKQTCKNGFWKSSMNDDVCCYKQKAYKPNTIIVKILAENDCTEIAVHCSQDGGAASLVFKYKNSKPATEAQVDNQTQVIDAKMDMLNVKIESEIANLEVKIEENTENKTKLMGDKMNSLELKMDKLEGLMENLKDSFEENMENLTQSLENCKAKTEDNGAVLRLPTHSTTSTQSWNVQNGKVDAIDFVSTSDIKIRGISMFGSFSGSATHSGLIQLKETLSQRILVSEAFEYTSNGDPVFYDKLFSSQYVAEMGVKYTITVEYYNTAEEKIWRGTGGQASTAALCKGNTITFQFTKPTASTNGSNKEVGQIPRILFSC